MSVEIIKENTFAVIKSAVDKTVDLISPTFGPSSNKVIISKLTHGFVLDDGVQIARDIELSDPAENAVMKIVRETAIKTNDRVGDGTTGALIMIQAIIDEIAKFKIRDGRKIEKELKKGFEECKKQLLEQAVPIVTEEELFKVALISFDDEKIAKLISEAWAALGKDGVLTVDRSSTMETYTEITDGIKIDRGYLSPYMITNQQRMEAVIEKPYILITDLRLTEVNDVLGIMEELTKNKIGSLVIIADNIEQNAMATLIINKMNGKFSTIAINTPAGENETILEDIAMMTGGKFFSHKKGDKVEAATIEDLGRAERFISRRNESVIVNPKGDEAKLTEAKVSLTKAIEEEKIETQKVQLRKRLAALSNKIGVIKVGAATENEVNALRYKVEDAVNAVKSAYKGGVVCGGGLSLARLETNSEILYKALQAPFRHLKNNSNIEFNNVIGQGEALNVVTGEIGNWMEIGVMDPVDVLIAQIESSVSIASLLATTSGIIVEKPAQLKQER